MSGAHGETDYLDPTISADAMAGGVGNKAMPSAAVGESEAALCDSDVVCDALDSEHAT